MDEVQKDSQVPVKVESSLPEEMELPDALKVEDYSAISMLTAPVLCIICGAEKLASYVVNICRKVVKKVSGTDPKNMATVSDLVTAYGWLVTATQTQLVETLGIVDALSAIVLKPQQAIKTFLDRVLERYNPTLTRYHVLGELSGAVSLLADMELRVLKQPELAGLDIVKNYTPVLTAMNALFVNIVAEQVKLADEEAIAYMLDESEPLSFAVQDVIALVEDAEGLARAKEAEEAEKANEPGFAREVGVDSETSS